MWTKRRAVTITVNTGSAYSQVHAQETRMVLDPETRNRVGEGRGGKHTCPFLGPSGFYKTVIH